MNRKKALIITIASITLLVLIYAGPLRSQGKNSVSTTQDIEKEIPVVEFDRKTTGPNKLETARASQELRINRGRRFDDWQLVREPSSAEVTRIKIKNGWQAGLSALPVEKSDVVLIGSVSDAQAFLSNDKNGVYSEFSIQVTQLLKNISHSLLTAGGSVTVERMGGRVRFSSNRVVTYMVSGQGMPRTGSRYAFFLAYDEQRQTYPLLTAYELANGLVVPVDGKRVSGGSWKFDVYDGVDESLFLKELGAALSQPSVRGEVKVS